VVDDHPLFRKAVKLAVGASIPTAIVYEASNGLEAFESIQKDRIDLVLLDLSMPLMDGFAFLDKIRSERLKLKKIVISLYHEPLLIQKLLDLGADGYVSKNCNGEKIVKSILAVLDGQEFVESYVDEELSRLVRDKRMPIRISSNEILLIRNLAEGKTSREIASTLGYTVRTVETKRRRLEKKMRARNAAEIVNAAYRFGILQV